MKKTGEEILKPFEIRVGMGIPSFGGMYRLGDPARTPPHRFHFLANVRFRDELQERPGSTVVEDSGQPDLVIVNMTQPPKYTDPEEASGKALGGLWAIHDSSVPAGPSGSLANVDEPWIMRWDSSKFPALDNDAATPAGDIHQIHYTTPSREPLHLRSQSWQYGQMAAAWDDAAAPPVSCLNDPEQQTQINGQTAGVVNTTPYNIYLRYLFDDWLVGIQKPFQTNPGDLNSQWLCKANFCEDSSKSSGTLLVPNSIVQANTGIRLLDGGPLVPISLCPPATPEAEVRDDARHTIVIPARYDNERTGEVFVTENIMWSTGMGGVYRYDGVTIFEEVPVSPVTLGQHPLLGIMSDNAVVAFGREGALFKDGYPTAAWVGVTIPAWGAPLGSRVVSPDCSNRWIFATQWGWSVHQVITWKDKVYFFAFDQADILRTCLNPDALNGLKIIEFDRATLTLSIIHAPTGPVGEAAVECVGVVADENYLYYAVNYDIGTAGGSTYAFNAYNGSGYVGRYDGSTFDDLWARVGGVQSRVVGGAWEVTAPAGMAMLEGKPHVVYGFGEYVDSGSGTGGTSGDGYYRIDRFDPDVPGNRELRLSWLYPAAYGAASAASMRKVELVTEI
jgi:hypothetical protein